jgi:hypothetical protein
MLITITILTILFIVAGFVYLIKRQDPELRQDTTKTIVSQEPTPTPTPEVTYNPTAPKKPVPSNTLS